MDGSQSDTADPETGLRRRFGAPARRWKRLLAVTGLAAGSAFALASLATPQFRSETRLLIEAHEPASAEPGHDEEGIASQVEVIASADILAEAARKLDLARRPGFQNGPETERLSQLLVLAGLKSDPAAVSPEERVLDRLREKLSVFQVDGSRVIAIRFSSPDAGLAAEVPNAVADAYLTLQRGAGRDPDATGWLKPEIDALTIRVREAEARVAEFRAKSDLPGGQAGSVSATQRLSDLLAELSGVRATASAAEASAAGLRAALAKGAPIDALPDLPSAPILQRLRERQVQLRTEIAELATTLLDNHPRLRALRSRLADLDGQIRTAARNAQQGLSAQAEAARLREQQLVSDLDALRSASARAGEEEVELRALEREASGQRELLESYRTRLGEASSRRDNNYLPADAHVLAHAVPAPKPYFPRVLPITVAAAVAALLLAAAATLLQELFASRATSPAALRPQGGAALVPAAAPDRSQADPQGGAGGGSFPSGAAERPPVAAAPMGATPEQAARRLIVTSAKRAVFLSPEGDEAAAASVLVAREASDAGLRVLLLDLSASGAASRPMLDSVSFPGVTNLLTAEAQFGDIIRADHYSDCHVIPVGTANPARAMRAADRLPIIMESLTTAYDLVVVECGAAAGEGISRLVAARTMVMVGVVDPASAAVAAELENLRAQGFDPLPVSGFCDLAPADAGRNAA